MSVVAVNTYTHSVTYVSDQLIRSLKLIITHSGLNPAKLVGDWATIDLGLRTWLGSQDLEKLVLEVFDPRTDMLVGRWDAEIDYTYGDGDGTMWIDADAIRYAINKAGVIPTTCDYRVLAETKAGRPDVAGWTPASYRSTSGFARHSVGTTIGTHAIGSDFGYWVKS